MDDGTRRVMTSKIKEAPRDKECRQSLEADFPLDPAVSFI